MELLKPGVNIHDYEREIEQFMGEKLRELGLIRTIDHESVRKYYPHATSHFLGLNVHDAGDYEQPLQAGTVLTVEPGIYIPEESIGIRIEDDVVITDTGLRVLSEALPSTLA
jgi:Xaa-Pro aminopeptidase